MAKASSHNGRKDRKRRSADEQASSTTLTLLRQTVRQSTIAVGKGHAFPPALRKSATEMVTQFNEWLDAVVKAESEKASLPASV